MQPNGEVLNVFITGDEFFRKLHDSEGYTIVQREDGWYCYALYDAVNDELISSEFIVSSNQQIQLPMEKGLGISYEKYIEIRRAYYEPTGCDPSGAAKRSIMEDLANAKTTQQMNNIVICIGFSDTPGMTTNYNNINGMFNTNVNNNVREYFNVMSYNKLDVLSHFYPPADGNVMRFYQAPNPRAWYKQNDNANTEHGLLRDAVNWVNANWPVPDSLNLDINNDGMCDFVTFILYGPTDYNTTIFWPHKWSLYSYNATINGKRVFDYNIELDGGGNNYFNVGTFCHEGFHCLGAPDLYHYSYDNRTPVGRWDIMETTANKPQSMSAYMKLRYGRWLYNNNYTHQNFPPADIDQTYEVFPFYTNDGSDPDKPVLHRIPITGTTTQFSVIEYRKRTGMNYDATLPNEGLMIYRINNSFNGNASYNGTTIYDGVFLYRPGSNQNNGFYTNGTINQAPFNTTNGRTAFNSTTDPKPCQSNGVAETEQNINNILYDNVTDSYSFFYGDPENRTISVNVEELFLSKASGAFNSINVLSNVLWRVTIPTDATDWLSANNLKGLNDGTVTFTTLNENNTGSIRSAEVTITGNNQSLIVTVIQTIDDQQHYTINVAPNNPDLGTVTGGGTFNHGESATITAIPNPCIDFAGWFKGSELFSEDLEYTFTVTESITLTAVFTECDCLFTLTIEINPEDAGTVTGAEDYYPCQVVTVTASPNDNWEFRNWTIDGNEISSATTHSFTITNNVTLVANFGNVGINKSEMSQFTIYPNPANQELRIKNYELRDGLLSEVEIFDVFGRNIVGAYRIRPIDESPNEIVIDVSSLPTGVYMIRLVGDGDVSVQRFTIFR